MSETHTSGPGRIATRRAGRVGIAAAVIVLAAGCLPMFNTGAVLSIRAGTGSDARLIWSTAFEADAGESMSYYTIYVDGVGVPGVWAPATNCILTGLASGTTYQISVVAVSYDGVDYEASSGWGGDLESLGYVTASYTTPPGAIPAGTKTCTNSNGATDTDGDRLPDWAETGSGVFVSPARTGTSSVLADTDGDGISDGDETLGTIAGLNLPGMGTNPLRANILLELDWFDDSRDCGTHSHQPTAAMMARVSTAFTNSPRVNPDGSTGITVIADYGQGGGFIGGNLISDPDASVTLTFDGGGFGGAEFLGYKAANFAANRAGYFYYVLLPHDYNGSSSSGMSELPGDDTIVSVKPCWTYIGGVSNPTITVSNTIMHELGHNLGLRHGGNTDTNYKPNYNSIMNYRYQFAGADNDCTFPGNGVMDFSRGTRASLNENALSETAGICSGVDIDWNQNAVIDGGTVAFDINRDFSNVGDGLFSTHTDYNDWANIAFGGLTNGDGAQPIEVIIETS